MRAIRTAIAATMLLSAVGAQASLTLNLNPAGFNTKSVVFDGFVLSDVTYDQRNLKLVINSDLGNLVCGPEDEPIEDEIYLELDGRVYNIDNTSQNPIRFDPDADGGPTLEVDVAQQDFSCAPSLDTSLSLSVDGQEALPVGSAVTHTVDVLPENNILAITINDPLLCAQVGQAIDQMAVRITDPNGETNDYSGIQSIDFDTTSFGFNMQTDGSLQCFAFPGGGIPRSVDGGGEVLFADDFEIRDVDLQVVLTTESSAIIGQTFDYRMTVTNNGPRDAVDLALNEFYPANSNNFPATLGIGSWTCSASTGANCGDFTNGIGHVLLTEADIPVGGSLTVDVSRTVNVGSVGTVQIFSAVYTGMNVPDPILANNVSTLAAETTTNDPPNVDLNGAAPGVNYSPLFVPGGPVAVADTLRATISDSNDTMLERMTLRLLSAPDGGLERLEYDCSLRGGITCTWTPATLEFVVEGTDSVTNYISALRSVAYNNFASSPDTSDRTVQITVNDGSSDSNVAVSTIRLQGSNDGPLVDLNGDDNGNDNDVNWIQDGGSVLLADANAIVDDDSTLLVGATVTITDLQDGADEFLLVNTAGSNIGSSYDSQTGTLSLFGADTVANYQDAVRSLRYDQQSPVPTGTSRVISVTVTDGRQISSPAFSNVAFTVNQPPVVDLNGPDAGGIDYNTTFNAGGPAVRIGDQMNLSVDDDSDQIVQAEVRIMNPLNVPNQEVLNAAGLCLDIGSSFNSSTHTLVLTGITSEANYEVCLRGVTYRNTAGSPDTANRIIEVRVFDGSLWNLPVAESTITIEQ